MSTSANAPGEPGRDRGDAGDPAGPAPEPGASAEESSADAQEATGASGPEARGDGDSDSGAVTGAGAQSAGSGRASQRSAKKDAGAARESGRAKDPGTDVTKKVKAEARASQAAVQSKPKKPRSEDGPGLFGRIALFIRQVIAEIRKVVQPTRQELLTFSVVVIVFILAMMAYVGVLDFAIGRLVLWVFGN
ncbi:MAG TPA: preprotein translocase subunit SecE [Beutenbergiaceae bacterium]|nr:preprotein translocase subunit SecE [Beutenbergiaceae bacterium]